MCQDAPSSTYLFTTASNPLSSFLPSSASCWPSQLLIFQILSKCHSLTEFPLDIKPESHLQSFFSFFFLNIFFIVVQLQLSAFSPRPSTPPQPNPPPSPADTLPLDFVHVSFIVVPLIPSPHYPLPTPPWLLLDCS